jgi:hypothetical protein
LIRNITAFDGLTCNGKIKISFNTNDEYKRLGIVGTVTYVYNRSGSDKHGVTVGKKTGIPKQEI